MTTKVPVELSSTPGIVDNSNATAITIDSSENVGIGTTSPDTKLEVESGASASHIVRSKATVADGYRVGFEAQTTHTGGGHYSMFTTNNGDGYFGGGKFVIASETMGDVDANTGTIIKIGNDGSAEFRGSATGLTLNRTGDHPWLGFSNNGTYTSFIYGSSAEGMRFFIGDNSGSHPERVRMPASGGLLVGLTSANGMSGVGIESSGSIRANNFILSTDLAGTGFRNLNSSANGTITNSTSLRELKENIVDMSLGLSDVLKLKPREFDWKDAAEHGTEDIGFIADEVFDVSPKLATYKVGDKTKDNLLGVKYDTMTSLLVKAIQEQQTIIDDLKSRIKTLEDA